MSYKNNTFSCFASDLSYIFLSFLRNCFVSSTAIFTLLSSAATERIAELSLSHLESLVKEVNKECSDEENEEDIDLSVSRLFKMKLLVKNFHQKTLGSHLPGVMDWNVQ